MSRLALTCRGARPVLAAVALFGLAVLSGCATLGVRPWERDDLARPAMTMDSDPLERASEERIYFARETSSGGRGFGAGGCGCN